MEDHEDYEAVEARNYNYRDRMMSPEIVEIGEDSREVGGVSKDVYVAVGKDDLHVLKWALDHLVVSSPASQVFLIHVFPTITHIPTPGKWSHTLILLYIFLFLCSVLF